MRTNLLKLLTVIGLAVLATGCKKNEPLQGPTLEIAPRVLSFGAEETAVQKRITVETTAPSFTYEVVYSGEQQDWLNVSQGDGFLDISVKSSNPGDKERKASVQVIVVSLLPQTVEVTQRAEGDQTDYTITLNPATLNFAASGSELTKTSTVTTKGNGLQASMEEGEDWYLAYLENNTLTVTVKPNASTDPRDGKVTVTNAQGKEATLRIVQDGKREGYDISLTPPQLTFESAGDNLTKTVTVSTAGTGISAEVDEGYGEWITSSLDGSTLTVKVGVNNGDERKGSVTVSNSEGGKAVLNVTQKSASDYSITLDPASLTFSSGETVLTKTSSIITNGTGLTAEVNTEDRDWLSASIDNKAITVTVTPATDYGTRTGSVRVANSEGDDATLRVTQAGLPAPDISGTWSWSSQYTTDGNWDNASEGSGTAVISRDGDDYLLTGIAGSAVQRLGVTDPVFHLDSEDGAVGLTDGAAFFKGRTYYSTSSLAFPAGNINVWNSEDAFVELKIEQTDIDGKQYRKITFPSSLVATEQLFPNDRELWGQTGTASYVYYETIQLGWEERATPIEFHRNIVLLEAL